MTAPAQVVAAPKRKRGTAFDMLRTLAVILVLVLPLWFFHQGGPGSRHRIRAVDPTEAYAAFVHDVHGPVPAHTPAGWVCTVTDTATSPGVLRVGYVHGDDYLEFVGGSGTAFLDDATGKAAKVGTAVVDGKPWQDWRSADGKRSLVQMRGGVTVLVGGVRETATQDELFALASVVSYSP